MATETTSPLILHQNEKLKIFVHALLFVAGFSLVFIVGWGGSVTLVGQLFGAYKRIIAQIGGIVVILFGLATLEVIRLPWFYMATRAQFSGRSGTFGGSALMGVFFAAGWSPCIGATLGAILTMGLSQQTVGQAMWLAPGYSLGLGIPLLAMALGLERACILIKHVGRFAATPTYLTAILAGLLSFLSPCVLPLVPAYLGYLSGHTIQRS